jgi:integrase
MQLTPSDVDRYREHRLSQTTVRGKSPTIATLNREVVLLKTILNLAVEKKMLRDNPLRTVKKERENNYRSRHLSLEEFQKLYNAAKNEAIQQILLFGFDTGLRKETILSLTWEKVDLTGEHGRVYLNETDVKTGSGVPVVVLTARVTAMLKEMPRALSGYVFVNPQTGNRWRDIRKPLARACKKAGIPLGLNTDGGIVFHDLRRSFVAQASRYADAKTVMTMTGHQSTAAFDRYHFPGATAQRALVDQLDKLHESHEQSQRENPPAKASGEREN